MAFAGFPSEALTFYAGLEQDNTREYWHAHSDVYEGAVREPLEEMLTALAAEFGQYRIFRPFRNLRFSRDKRPYKTGAIMAEDLESGGHRYVELNANGLRLGGGRFHPESDELERTRRAIAQDGPGAELEAIKASLERAGMAYMPAELKTAPRGYPKDHPRIELLRRKRHMASTSLGAGPWLHTAEAKERVAATWRTVGPLIAWLDRYATA